MAESKLVQLNFENNSYNVCSIIFMYSVYWALAAFWYQILLSPISSCIHFKVWFYFTWPRCFFGTKGVLAWDVITFVRLTITATSNKLILVTGNIPGKVPNKLQSVELFKVIKLTNVHVHLTLYLLIITHQPKDLSK